MENDEDGTYPRVIFGDEKPLRGDCLDSKENKLEKMTSKKIEEMNIPLGTLIEIAINDPAIKPYKAVGYYHGLIHNAKKGDTVSCDSNTLNDSNWKPLLCNQFMISSIEKVRVVEYPK